ncbi:uncharacterized protein ALTATR162_LOCUS5031 [Alternaria atra]|uniref:BZIP domain-containing protein n=1 Tax=Alternaria atra TaxID=119953 RepID=A0A8J2N1D2_9PLEO|nr:uncharacterized protein ALTATR162_LOCUS5031 [Alternaria atra]CAG5158194.1 unnamed protein product [Alternaria atra]
MKSTYFDALQQPYHHFTSTMSDPFAHVGVDPVTIRSIEPLDDAALIPGAYDAFTLYGPPTLPLYPTQDATEHTVMPVGRVDSKAREGVEDGITSKTSRSGKEKALTITPAQKRRKAQNRAAQKAFRERKERHVRDLEARISAFEKSSHSLQSENEWLRLALQCVRSETESLCDTLSLFPSSSSTVSVSCLLPDTDVYLPYEESSYKKSNMQPPDNGSVAKAADKEHAASRCKVKCKEVSFAQAWDLVQSHPLVKQGLVRVVDVYERLRGALKCNGHDFVFEESTIWQVIEDLRQSGGDELM